MSIYENKLVLITGGSSGIGLALAKNLAAQGANIWIVARRRNQLDLACQEIEKARKNPDQQICSLSADVADREQVTCILQDFVENVGIPDYLVNSAGITYPGMFEDLPLEIFDQMMATNYMGTVNVIKALLPGMSKRHSGHIVLVSSFGGLVGGVGYSAYGASKFAIRGLADVLRVELKYKGIKVSLVVPPDTQTPQLEYENQFKPALTRALVDENLKAVSPEYVAEKIARDVARGRYMITPGFDTTFYYYLTNTGGIVYPIMDFLVNQAWKKVNGSKNRGTEQNEAQPDEVRR